MGAAARPGIARFLPAGAAVGALALVWIALLASASRADVVYWDNFEEEPATIGFSNVDGSGGGLLNTTGVELRRPEGMAYDPITGRLYLASEANGQVAFIDVAGGGGGVFTAPGAPIGEPAGIALDPVNRMVYWLNQPKPESISWARLDGSAGGVLNTSGATLDGAYRLAVDPAGGRIYWGNEDGSLAFANLNGTGGGDLDANSSSQVSGVSIDPLTQRIFWSQDEDNRIFMAGLGSAEATEIDLGAAPINAPWGLAFDPTISRLYWANNENGQNPAGAIGIFGLGSGPGSITPAGAPVGQPQDPIVIKNPLGTGAPTLTRSGGELSCSQGTWAPDAVASFVYAAPRSFAYAWTVDGATIPGATLPTYRPAVPPGTGPRSVTYRCVVTAVNQAGSSAQTSAGVTVELAGARPRPPVRLPKPRPANLGLTVVKPNLKAKPGKVAVVKAKLLNTGGSASKPAKLCLAVAQRAGKALRPGKCQSLGPIGPGASAIARLRVRVKGGASPGTRKLRVTLSGAKPATVTLRVLRKDRKSSTNRLF